MITTTNLLSSKHSEMMTIQMMSGEKIEGILHGFSPNMQALRLFSMDEQGSVIERKLLPTDVTYVAQSHQSEGSQLSSHEVNQLEECQIRSVHLEHFRVKIIRSHSAGIFCICDDGLIPYERIFFYHHGINFKDRQGNIADLLLKEFLVCEHLATVEEIDTFELEGTDLGLADILKKLNKHSDEVIHEALKAQRDAAIRLGSILMGRKVIQPEQLSDALEKQKTTQKFLGVLLLESGAVDNKTLLSAIQFKKHQRRKLGELLIEEKLITRADLQLALEEQTLQGLRLGETLLKKEMISEAQLLTVLSKKFCLPCVDLDTYSVNPLAAIEVERKAIEKYQFFPVDTEDRLLTVAIAEPLVAEAYDQISFSSGKKIREIMVSNSQLQAYIDTFFDKEEHEDTSELLCEFLQVEEEEEYVSDFEITKSAEDAPIIRLVNRMISNALKKNASDIHILPQENKILLAYRLNGQLLDESSLDKSLHAQITARIKILSGMDIAERRMPQDGRMVLRDGKRTYEFRVSCIPNADGESIVLRVLNKSMAVDLDGLGLRREDVQKMSMMVRQPYGLILVTGPTGSGKSTTLFAALQSIAALPVHIITIEDPVESRMKGVNQIQTNHSIGLTFSRVLRNVLRHDPDVIMIGEMRDPETASIGIEASLTGHLMLSTLHTNSAVDTIIRLNDLNVPNYLIAPALLGVMSQSLLKKLCVSCRHLVDDDEVYGLVAACGLGHPERLYEAVGCEHCHGTGYDGRVMVYELLTVNDAVRRAIYDGVDGEKLQQVAIEAGMISKSQSTFQLAVDGVVEYNDFLYSVM